jgi:hypothetical protein
MLSDTKRQVINLQKFPSGWLIYLNCVMKHGSANVKQSGISVRPYDSHTASRLWVVMVGYRRNDVVGAECQKRVNITRFYPDCSWFYIQPPPTPSQ